MTDQSIVTCSEHQKQCTDYCTFNFCKETYLFICPRCIQRKMNHVQHKNCLKDINSKKDIIQVIQDIMMSNSDYTYEINQIQKLVDLNNYFIDSLNTINKEIQNQMGQMIQNDQQIFKFILQNSQISTKNPIQSNVITDLIQKIIQDSTFHDNQLYKQILDQLKSVYENIGKQIQSFSKVVDKNIQQKQINLQKSIQMQFQEITNFQQQSLKEKTFQFNEKSFYVENDISVNQSFASASDSQNNDISISKVNLNQVLDLFSSNIDYNQPKKILIQNPAASAKKEKQVNFSLDSFQQSDSKEHSYNNQMLEEEESKHNNENHANFQQIDIKQDPKQIKKLTSFKPNLIAKEPLGEVSIYCINQNQKIILLTHNQLPYVLQIYELSNMRYNDSNIIQFNDGNIVDAHISEDLQKIFICSSTVGRVYKLKDGKSFQLSTKKDKNICKIQVEQNDYTIVIYEDYSFEIYHYDNIQPYQEITTNQIQEQKSQSYFVRLIENNIVLQLQQNKCLKVVNLQNNLCLFDKQEKYCLNSIEINSGKNLIATSGLSEIVTIYSYDQEKKEFNQLNKIETGHNDEILQTKFINGDKWLVTISGDCTWKVFDTMTGQTIYFSSNDSQNAYIKCEYFAFDQSLIFIDQYGELAIFQLQ
ncbi:hypothetical protein ABPG72_005636 [Tetrahymena utriculariae]